jgi:hypothetical protein
MGSNLLLKLSESLKIVHNTHFIRLPHQPHQEPIDYLLQTSTYNNKKWKSNRNNTNENQQKERKFSRLLEENLTSNTSNSPTHFKTNLHESVQKINCVKIPIKCNQSMVSNKPNINTHDIGHHSYSTAFMLRYDDNLIKFSKSYGLKSHFINHENNGNAQKSKKNAAFDSYAHLFSINLDNELSTFEIWLNPNGNLLFIRRADQSIIITFNFMHITSNTWHFIYINYNEEQFATKLNCRISYSINLSDIVDKEFEIFNDLDKNNKRFATIYNSGQNQGTPNLFLYLGHQEKRSESACNSYYLFNYDLGQFILSKDSQYTIEHLIIIMHIMDTNFAHLDMANKYDMGYMNGQQNFKIKYIDNIQKSFNELCDQIKCRTIAVYNPRNPQVCAIKYANNRTLSFIDIATTCKSQKESSFDIVLARIGGIQQMLILIAKLVEQESLNFYKTPLMSDKDQNNMQESFTSLTILEIIINLLNKRPHIHFEFKEADGYSLIQRVFSSIASNNKFLTIKSSESLSISYFTKIQNKLFLNLINGCFQTPVFCLSTNFMSEKIDLTFNLKNSDLKSNQNPELMRRSSSSLNFEKAVKLSKKPSLSSVYLINAELLSQVLIEWDLWRPLSVHKSYSNDVNSNIWQHMFKILNTLLEDENPSQIYHMILFLKNNILEKLMFFLLDANGENFLLDNESCQYLVKIFNHFNTVYNNLSNQNSSLFSARPISKQLFQNFSDYLYILHSEKNVYIVNQKNEFYFNLSFSKLAVFNLYLFLNSYL